MRNFTKIWLSFGKSYHQQRCNSWEELADHHTPLHSALGLIQCAVTNVCVSHCVCQCSSPQTFGNASPYHKLPSFHFYFVEYSGCHTDEKENTRADRLYYLWASRYLKRHYEKKTRLNGDDGPRGWSSVLTAHWNMAAPIQSQEPRCPRCRYFHLLKRDSLVLTLSRELLGVLGCTRGGEDLSPWLCGAFTGKTKAFALLKLNMLLTFGLVILPLCMYVLKRTRGCVRMCTEKHHKTVGGSFVIIDKNCKRSKGLEKGE